MAWDTRGKNFNLPTTSPFYAIRTKNPPNKPIV